jgi:hypothetical protein
MLSTFYQLKRFVFTISSCLFLFLCVIKLLKFESFGYVPLWA